LMYLKSWFPLDAFLVVLDWALMLQDIWNDHASSGEDKMAQSAKLARAVRIMRLLRLMRLAKLKKLLFTLQNIIDSEWVLILVAVGKNLIALVTINHFLACIWYTVGSGAGSDGWVERYGFQDAGLVVQYLVSLQWSLAQFTPGATPIQPSSLAERVYAAFVLCLGLVVATCFVSSITSTMAAVWTMNRHKTTQTILLKRFIKQHDISRSLGARISHYVDFVLAYRHQKVHPSKVEFLTYLSGPLHIELQTELYQPTLNLHPSLLHVMDSNMSFCREICTTMLDDCRYAKSDAVFLKGIEAKHLIFMTVGSLAYRRKDKDKKATKIRLETGSVFVEPVLWIVWKHIGEARALTEATTVTLNAGKFRDAVRTYHDVLLIARGYAFDFWTRYVWFDDSSNVARVEVNDLSGYCSQREEEQTAIGFESEVADYERLEAELVQWADEDQ